MALAAGAGCQLADSRPPSWSFISATITEPNCATASCHSRATAASGLDFSSPDRGFTSLSGLWVWIVDPAGTAANGCRTVDGSTVCQREHRSLLIPFNPAQSRVVQLLRGRNAPRMPPDRPLTEADVRLFETWILDGAVNDRAVAPPIDDGAGGSGGPEPDKVPAP